MGSNLADLAGLARPGGNVAAEDRHKLAALPKLAPKVKPKEGGL